MGQEEVKNVLEKAKDWLLSREIAQKAQISLGSVQASLQRMIKWGEVETRKAREVIKDKSRIKSNSAGIAYRLKESQTDLKDVIKETKERSIIREKTAQILRKLPTLMKRENKK